MADLRDVMNALAAICATTLYPSGTSNPVSPVNGAVSQVKTGWPVSGELDIALAAGIVTVTLFAVGNSKNTTRFLPQWQNVGTATAGSPGTQETVNEIRRVQREIQITTWASTPNLRDTTGAALDVALAMIDRLPLADGSTGQMRFSRDAITDAETKERSYRRDLFYSVDYGTYQTGTSTLVTEVIANAQGGVSIPDSPVNTITVIQGH